MTPRLRPSLLLLLAGLFFAPAPGGSQEVGVSVVRATSDHQEMPSPHGHSAFLLVELGPDWMARVSFHRIADETVKEGTVCLHYSPRIGCGIEETRTGTTLSGLRGSILRVVRVGSWLRMGAGAGLSFNQVDTGSTGITGRRGDILHPTGGQIGAFGRLSVAVAPYPAVPARIFGGLNLHWVDFRACSGEDPPAYDPFCTAGRFRELEAGLSFAF